MNFSHIFPLASEKETRNFISIVFAINFQFVEWIFDFFSGGFIFIEK